MTSDGELTLETEGEDDRRSGNAAADPFGVHSPFDVTTPIGNLRNATPSEPEKHENAFTGQVLKGQRGRYRLGKPLGMGGMGAVFLAAPLEEHATAGEAGERLPAEIAIKTFRNDWRTNPGELLKREVSAMRALRHPRIPKVFDFSTHGDTPFVAVEYFPGGSLADEIKRNGALPVAAAWHLLEDLLSALSCAHRAAVLHLDVKPGNVLCDSNDRFSLTDFGISQGFLVSKSIVPSGLGAPVFQSPEQKRADTEAFDERTDLWGVGITVWAALTGSPPLDIRNFINACSQENHGLPPPSALRPDCPAELESVLMPLVAVDPDNRPGSAGEALARVQASSPYSQRPSGSGTSTPSPLHLADSAIRRSVFENLMDPLWRSICRTGELNDRLVHFRPGEMLCGEGADSYRTFVLLRGNVRIERGGRTLAVEEREGAFLGEVTSLIGAPRTASMKAIGDVWALVFNPAQLERFVTRNPALAIRMMKVLAERLHRESETNAKSGLTEGTLP